MKQQLKEEKQKQKKRKNNNELQIISISVLLLFFIPISIVNVNTKDSKGNMTVSLVQQTIIFLSFSLCTQAFHFPHFSIQNKFIIERKANPIFGMSASSSDVQSQLLSWDELKEKSAHQAVGNALNKEVEMRKSGKGSAHVQSKLRLFSSEEKPKITLYRDHAGCKYFFLFSTQCD